MFLNGIFIEIQGFIHRHCQKGGWKLKQLFTIIYISEITRGPKWPSGSGEDFWTSSYCIFAIYSYYVSLKNWKLAGGPCQWEDDFKMSKAFSLFSYYKSFVAPSQKDVLS